MVRPSTSMTTSLRATAATASTLSRLIDTSATTICQSAAISVFYALNSVGTLVWSFSSEYGGINSSPAIAPDGSLVFGAHDHRVYSVSSSGGFSWSYQTAGLVDSSPAIAASGDIWIGSKDKILYALDSKGALRWSYTASLEINSSPALSSDGMVYFGCDGAFIYAIASSGVLA